MRGAGAAVRFAGYAALFDKVDKGGDIICKGAFARSLAKAGKHGIPLLWQHRPDNVIGHIDQLAEDERGLRVIATVNGSSAEAAEAVRSGAVKGLSFGYRVRAGSGGRPRLLHDLELVEVSLVSFPMQPLARIHAVEDEALAGI